MVTSLISPSKYGRSARSSNKKSEKDKEKYNTSYIISYLFHINIYDKTKARIKV